MFLKFKFQFLVLAASFSFLHSSIQADPPMNQRERENVTRWWRNKKYSVSGAVSKMSSRIQLNGTVGYKQLSFLQSHPRNLDVAFAVGPERIIVKAPKIFLTVASPVFEREFPGRWENDVAGETEIFSLPDLNPEAFKLFVELAILNSWSVESLKALELPLNQLLYLMSVCHKYDMTSALKNLTELAKDVLSDFSDHVKPEEFLLLSQAQVETILASNELAMNETDVFNYACWWAEEQCRKQKMEVTGENLRLVLGRILYQVRFPVMSITTFANVIQHKGLLSVEEIAEVLQLIVNGKNGSNSNATTEFKFKVENRRENSLYSSSISTSSTTAPTTTTNVEEMNKNPASSTQTFSTATAASTIQVENIIVKKEENSFGSVPAGISAVSLAQVFQVVDTPFVCDGSLQGGQYFKMDMNITLWGFGFLGPINTSSFYNVTVEIWKYEQPNSNEYVLFKREKRIFAEKSKTFYFIFDQPLVLNSIPHDDWNNFYYIDYALMGPNTRSLQYEHGVTKRIKDGSKEFVIRWWTPQLVEIVYNTI